MTPKSIREILENMDGPTRLSSPVLSRLSMRSERLAVWWMCAANLLVLTVAWHTGALARYLFHSPSAQTGRWVSLVLMCLAGWCVGWFAVFSFLESAPVMFLRAGGFRRLDADFLLWAATFSRKDHRHSAQHRTARTTAWICSLWLWFLPCRRREHFIALLPQSRCTLGELRAVTKML